MANFDAILQPPARRFYDSCNEAERLELDRILDSICVDPFIDNEVKLSFDYAPAVAVLYYDGWFWLVYHAMNNWTLSVLNIGFEEDPPRTT